MSFNKTKTDPALGQLIHQHLVNHGVETPVVPTTMERKEKIERIEKSITDIMNIMGLDLNDDSLHETPRRVAKMFINETMWGLDFDAFPKCTTIQNKFTYDSVITLDDINVQSKCEHHLMPVIGRASIAYIPNKKVLGLSKFPRIVEYFSKRPQVQERLTEQIYYALQYVLETDDIGIVIRAKHLCVSARGVEDTNARAITSKLGGRFRDAELRAEFMSLVNSRK